MNRENDKPEIVEIDFPLKNFDDRLTLAHLSDLHYSDKADVPLQGIIDRIKIINPDYFVITGDAIGSIKGPGRLEQLLDAMPCPGFATPGNWEHHLKWKLADQDRFYEKHGVGFLLNRWTCPDEKRGLCIAGVDDPFIGQDDLKEATKGIDEKTPVILLAHAPIIARQLPGTRIDLTLCGHTHGGQIRLPLVGALVIPPGSGGYEMGMYDVGDKKMYVNRGIGTAMISLRMFCPPEITVFRLHGESA